MAGRGITSSKRWCAKSARRWSERLDKGESQQRCDDCRFWVPTTGAFDPPWGACARESSDFLAQAVPDSHGCEQFESGLPLYLARDKMKPSALHSREKLATQPAKQCGTCRFFVRLDGTFVLDWGVCAKSTSPLDGFAAFEHEGCFVHEEAIGGWSSVNPVASIERAHSDAQPDRWREFLRSETIDVNDCLYVFAYVERFVAEARSDRGDWWSVAHDSMVRAAELEPDGADDFLGRMFRISSRLRSFGPPVPADVPTRDDLVAWVLCRPDGLEPTELAPDLASRLMVQADRASLLKWRRLKNRLNVARDWFEDVPELATWFAVARWIP